MITRVFFAARRSDLTTEACLAHWRGPMPTGRIQPEFVQRLGEVGKWMEKNGESVYGTRGGPLAPRSPRAVGGERSTTPRTRPRRARTRTEVWRMLRIVAFDSALTKAR